MVVGCSSPTLEHAFDSASSAAAAAPTYDFESTFSDSERAAIAAGFDEWPATIHDTLHVWRVTKDDAESDHCPLDDSTPNDRTAGYTSGSGAMCFYVDEIGPDSTLLEKVAAHEYGHALGLPHYFGTEPSIMRADLDEAAPTVAPIDIVDLREVQSQ